MRGLGPLRHDPSRVRSQAEDLLSRPPFASDQPGPIRRFLQLVGDAIARFLDGLFGDALALGWLPWLMVAMGTVLLGWLVWRITRGLTMDRSVPEVPVADVSRTAADWHAEADAAEARGELREALRARYGALVATLSGAGVLEDLPGRTVRELDTEVAGNLPGVAAEVEAAGRRFELAVYGHREVTVDDLRTVADAVGSVDAAVGRRAAGVRS